MNEAFYDWLWEEYDIDDSYRENMGETEYNYFLREYEETINATQN